ncbi:hypothetical protein V6N13_122096 [Hibiscus sabdariffa]
MVSVAMTLKTVKMYLHFIESHRLTGILASSGNNDFKIWTPKPIDKAVLPTQNELDKQLWLVLISFLAVNKLA